MSYSRPPDQAMKYSNLYISNLPKNVTEKDLDVLFGQFGEIVQRNVLKDKISGLPRGVAFVRLGIYMMFDKEAISGYPKSCEANCIIYTEIHQKLLLLILSYC